MTTTLSLTGKRLHVFRLTSSVLCRRRRLEAGLVAVQLVVAHVHVDRARHAHARAFSRCVDEVTHVPRVAITVVYAPCHRLQCAAELLDV